MKKTITICITFLLLFTSFVFASKDDVSLTEYTLLVEGQSIQFDVQPQFIYGKLMLPLRTTLEKMDYIITWNNEERAVELSKGVNYAKVFIGKNSYFKHKMAPFTLSSEPIIVDGRTLVPIEFFHEVLNIYFEIENSQITFYPNEDVDTLVTHMGYVSKINEAENTVEYHLSNDKEDEVHLIIHATKETIFQNTIKEGDFIRTVSPPIMLLSYPGQTRGIIIYK
ncbi:stalk domain-containing protein [Serpentinicella alkaliphila]|uniref:Copper amine oxidase-like protein n=1 Tax=Serpentinicella alkaliphila TaxID=1734049 RepID=A0A4R2THW1_9FIRM|nr:stalk domain-containing protein [Serpentinicella alkaliphila]QUH24901.1 hypothetical protein HZR23_03265 [Serpentinicella alkaliphila]TCQ01822.1 copper amine oxidase-like protein [Serpentinicella alkaliphila]